MGSAFDFFLFNFWCLIEVLIFNLVFLEKVIRIKFSEGFESQSRMTGSPS